MKSSIKRELIDIPLRSCSDTVSERYRSTSPTPTWCRSSIGAPLRLRYCSDTVSEKYRSSSPTPILCRSRVGPTPFCSETSPTSFQMARLGPTSFRHRGSVVHPPTCPAAWCGQIGCNEVTRCGCDDHTQGARDARLQLQQMESGTLTPGNEQLHHAERWPGPQEWGVAENSWRCVQTDHYGKARYGWGTVADTFMQDPRWQDYMRVVRSGLSAGLSWKQYIAAIENTQRWGNHEARHWTHHLARTPPQLQAQEPRSQVPRWMEAAIPVPTKKELRLKEHRRRVALMSGSDDAEGKCRKRIITGDAFWKRQSTEHGRRDGVATAGRQRRRCRSCHRSCGRKSSGKVGKNASSTRHGRHGQTPGSCS